MHKSNMKHKEFESFCRGFVVKDSLSYITLRQWIINGDVVKDLEV